MILYLLGFPVLIVIGIGLSYIVRNEKRKFDEEQIELAVMVYAIILTSYIISASSLFFGG